MKNTNFLFTTILTSIFIASCGGGGGGGGSEPSTPAAPLPVVNLSSSSSSSEINQDVTLTWTSSNASSCSASGDWEGSKSLSGSESVKIKKKGTNTFTLTCTGSGGSSSKNVTVDGVLTFTITAPSSLSDYEPFTISVADYSLDDGQEGTISVTQSSGKNILFPKVIDGVFSARAPATYNTETIVLNVSLSLSDSIEESQEVSIDVNFNNVALNFDDFLEFNPAADIAQSLENDNYFIWDIIPFARTETKTIPAGTIYCYPTPNDCSTVENPSTPGFIPADTVAGDFDGDGDQDVLFVADIGDRVFKSFGSDADKSYWSTIHILFNDGTGRLTEDTTKYENGEVPRLPAPYHVVVSDFNSDGIDDAFIGSFGVPIINENNTNSWNPYPHLILMSGDSIHKNIQIEQGQPSLQLIPQTQNNFAHDGSSGDVDGDGDIDVFMNSTVYFSDSNGNFDIVGLNQQQVNRPCCGLQTERVHNSYPHASTIGDYNNDGIDDLAIFWANKTFEENGTDGAKEWGHVLLGPLDKDNPTYLDSEDWKVVPEPFYGPKNANYNYAASADINGDGNEDILVASTRKSPYYAGRHVQVLISNGDGTFTDETTSRFSYQPRSELDPSLSGTGIGEGVLTLQDFDGDGDLDLIDTQAIYGGEDFKIYPRLTLAVNDGNGNFEEVALDYFPNRAQFTLFDNALDWGFDGTKLMIRGGMLDLDGEGHLDYVAQIQGTFNAQDNDLFSAPQQSFISTFSMISKQDPLNEVVNPTETIEVSIEANSSGSGNVYVIDGVQKKSLTLNVGTTYTFNHSSAHPLRFSSVDDGTHGGGNEYMNEVTKSSGVTTIKITADTPSTLYYYCDVHAGMGADITVN